MVGSYVCKLWNKYDWFCIVWNHLKSIYLLDEPEAALSPQRQLTLLLDDE